MLKPSPSARWKSSSSCRKVARQSPSVGDGINDSAALAHASVSISFAGATDMARETADIVLMDDNLSSLILAVLVSKHAMSVVRQNQPSSWDRM